MFTSSSFLLATYVGSETIRANYAYYAFHNFPQISASLVTVLAEGTKLLVAASFLACRRTQTISAILDTLKTTSSSSTLDSVLQYSTPAALYLINNLIYFTVLPHATPILLHVCMLMKLPATAILHHFLIKKQHSVHAWVSLAVLCVGLVVFNIPSKSQVNSEHMHWYIAPIAGLIIAILSALASISAEKLTKIGDFWASQVCLYAFGLFFAMVAYPLVFVLKPDTSTIEVPQDSLTTLVLLVIVTAITGLVVAVVLRARDNILKIIGIAASLVTIAISQYIFLPELRPFTFTVWKIGGGGVVCMTTWTYNYYSKESSTGHGTVYLPVVERPDENAREEDAIAHVIVEKPASGCFVPDATKILSCSIVIAFCTVEVAWRIN